MPHWDTPPADPQIPRTPMGPSISGRPSGHLDSGNFYNTPEPQENQFMSNKDASSTKTRESPGSLGPKLINNGNRYVVPAKRMVVKERVDLAQNISQQPTPTNKTSAVPHQTKENGSKTRTTSSTIGNTSKNSRHKRQEPHKKPVSKKLHHNRSKLPLR